MRSSETPQPRMLALIFTILNRLILS